MIIVQFLFIVSASTWWFTSISLNSLYKREECWFALQERPETVAVKITYFDPDYMATVTGNFESLPLFSFKTKSNYEYKSFRCASIEVKTAIPFWIN